MPSSVLSKGVVVLALILALTACLARPSRAEPDRARFARNLGGAYFCFHRWISAPYREGKFVAGAPHRTATIVKAGTALLYAVKELKAAKKVASSSKDPALHKFSRSVDSLTNIADSTGRRFKAAKFAASDIDALDGAFIAMDSSARAAKIEVKDVPVTVPGA